MANELGTGGLLGSLTGKSGANAASVSSHHTAMVTGASGRAKDAAAPMITIGNMTVNNDSSNGSVIKTVEKNNQYKPADTSMLKMGGFFSTSTGKLESAINKQTELIEKQSTAIVGKLEGIQAAAADVSQTIKNAMSAQISAFEEYSAFVEKQNAKTTLLQDVWMVISKDAREKEANVKPYFNANQPAAWSKSDTFSLTKTLPNALAKINENLVTRFTDPNVRRTLISETLKHYQRVYKFMQDIIAGIENIRYNTHPIDQYVKHEFDVYNRAHHLGVYNPRRYQNGQQPPQRKVATLKRTRDFDTLTADDIAEALKLKTIDNANGANREVTLIDDIKATHRRRQLKDSQIMSDKSYIINYLLGNSDVQKKFRGMILADREKKQKKDPIDNISDKTLKALIDPTNNLTKATMLSADANGALQHQMKNLGLAVDTNTSTVEKASSAMDAAMKLFTRFVNFKNIGSLLLKVFKFYNVFRMGKSILGLTRSGIGLASSGVEKISSGFNWLKDRVPFVKSISDAIASWWEKAKNYFHEKIGSTIETYVTKPIVGKITNLFDGVFGSGTFDKTLSTISNYSRAIFTTAFGKDPAERERAWSTLKNGITNGFENIVKKYIIPAIAKVTFAIYSWKNLTKTVGKIPGAFSTIGKMWKDGVNLGSQVQGSPVITGVKNAWGELKHGNLREATRAIRGGLSTRFNFGKAVDNLHGVKDIKAGWDEIHQGFKKFTQVYSAVGRGFSNAIHGTGIRVDANGNTIDTSSKLDLYKSIEKLLHSTGSAPKATWGFIHGAYTNIKNNGLPAAFNTAINNLKGKFSTLGASIVGLPRKFKDMKTAFGGFGKMMWAGTKGLSKGIFQGAIPGGFKILAGLGPLAKGLASLATGVGIPIAIIAFLIKMIMPAFKSAQTKGVGVGQYLKDTIVGWFENIKKTLYTEVGGFGGLAKMVMGGIVGVIDGVWTGIKSLFNASSAAGLIFNIGKVFLDGVIALIPLLFKIVAKGIKIAVVDIPKALLWDLPKMIIDAVFGGGGKSKKSKVVPHAKGGIVDSPTYFKFAKGGTTQTGLMGEAGPEAILKLRRGKDGVLGVSIADSSNSLQQAIKLLDRTNAVTSSAMKRLTDAITRPNSFYDPKTVKQFTSTFKKLDISSDRLKLLSDAMTRNAGKEITVDNINELAALLYDINTEQTSGNTDTFNQVKALSDSQTKANKDQSKRDTERNKTLTDSKNVTKVIEENLPPKGFWDKFAGWWEDTKLDFARAWGGLIGDYSYVKMTDSQSIDRFGASVKDVERILGQLLFEEINTVTGFMETQPGSDDMVEAQKNAAALKNLLKVYETNSLTESDIKSIEALIKANGAKILGYDPLGGLSGDSYNADNLVKILEESKKFNKDTLDGVKDVLEVAKGVLQGESITDFMAAINKTPDFSEDIREKIKQVIIDQNSEQVTEDTMKKIVEIVTDIKENQEDSTEGNNTERSERKAAESAIQKQIRSIKEYFVGGKFFADIDKAKMTVGGIMKTIGSSIYNLVTGKQNAAIGNALKDTFGAGFGGLAAGLMGDSKAYELMNKINENAVKHGHSDVQRMMTSARHTILSDVSDIAQFTKDTKITSEELASILKDAEKYGWNISSESFKKLDAQIKGIPYVPEGKNGTTNDQTEGTSTAQGNNGKFDFSSITVAESNANQFKFDARHLDESSKTSLLGSIKTASDNATSDQVKSRYSRLGEAVSTGKYESLSSSDWEILKNLAPDSSKDTVSKMQDTISSVRFETYADKLLKTEGGYLSNDAGRGPSNRGILESTLKQAIKKGIIKDTNIKDLTKEDAVKIYKMMYWDDPKIGNLPSPIDYLVFDTNVNGGALNVLHRTLKKLGVNGYDKAKFGKTISAVIDYCQSPEKTKKFGETFLQARVERYINLVRKDESKEQYFKGWMNRIAAIAKQTGLNSPFKDGKITDAVARVLEETGSDELEIDNDSIKVETQPKPTEQPTSGGISNWWDGFKRGTARYFANNFTSNYSYVKTTDAQSMAMFGAGVNDVAKVLNELYTNATVKVERLSYQSRWDRSGEIKKQLAEAEKEKLNLGNILENFESGKPIEESGIKLVNTLIKAREKESLGNKVVDGSIDSKELAKQQSGQPAKPATAPKPTNQRPTTNETGAIKVEAQSKPAKQPENKVATNPDTNAVTINKPVNKAKVQAEPAKPVTANPNTNTVTVNQTANNVKTQPEPAKQPAKLVTVNQNTNAVTVNQTAKPATAAKSNKNGQGKSGSKRASSKGSKIDSLNDNRLDLMEKIISSNLPEDEKDRRLQRIMDSYNDEYPKRRRKSGTAKKSSKTSPVQPPKQPPVQSATRDDLIEFVGTLRAKVFNKSGELASKMTDSSNSAELREQYIEQYNKVAKEYKYLTGLYKSTENGSDPTESDVNRLNVLAEAYGEKPLNYSSYKPVVGDSTQSEVNKQVKEQQRSKSPAKSTTDSTKSEVTKQVEKHQSEQTAKPATAVKNNKNGQSKPRSKSASSYLNQSSKEPYDNRLDLMEKIISSNLPEDEKDRRLQRIMDSYNDEYPKRRRKSSVTKKRKKPAANAATADSTKAKVDELAKQPPAQSVNRDDLMNHIDQLRNAVRSREHDLSSLSQADVTGKYSKEWAKAKDDLRNLDNLYEKANNGSPITESDVKLINDMAEAYEKKSINYDLYKFVDGLHRKADNRVHDLVNMADSASSIYGDIDEYNKQLAKAREEEKNLSDIYENLKNGSDPAKSDIEYVNTLAEAYGEKLFNYSSSKKVVDAKPIGVDTASKAVEAAKAGQSAETKTSTDTGTASKAVNVAKADQSAKNEKLTDSTASKAVNAAKNEKPTDTDTAAKAVNAANSDKLAKNEKPVDTSTAAKAGQSAKSQSAAAAAAGWSEDEKKSLATKSMSSLIESEAKKQAEQHSEQSATNRINVDDLRKTIGELRADTLLKANKLSVQLMATPSDELREQFNKANEELKNLNDLYKKTGNGSNIAESDIKYVDTLVEARKKEMLGNSQYKPEQPAKPMGDSITPEVSKQAEQGSKQTTGQVNQPTAQPKVSKNDTIKADEKQSLANDLMEWNNAYSNRRRESAMAKKKANQPTTAQLKAGANDTINVDAQAKPAEQSKNTINHMEVTFQGRPDLVDAINRDFEKKMNGQASNTSNSIDAGEILRQLEEDSKKESAARKAREEANRVKIDDRYAGFVQNLIHEADLDIQGKSWIETVKSATSDEPSERSKIEDLKKVLDEINSKSLSASTRNFLDENKDNFEAYLSRNAKATQFKMSDAARSGLIELLKKKQDIAAKDKDGGLFTSNSTKVNAQRTYEALGKAIKEVQTDSLTNASMDLLFGDKELYKYVKNLSYQPTAIDEAFSKEIPDAAFDLSKTAEKANIKHQQMVQQALEQVTDEDFKKNPYTSLQNAVEAIKNATALQYVALTKMERPNVANVSNATVSTNNNSSVYANQSNMGNNDNIGLIGLGMYSGSDAILSSSPIW